MLRIDHSPTFWADVKPKPVGGEDRSFRALFRVPRRSENDAFDLKTDGGLDAMMAAVIAKVDDVLDAQGKPLTAEQAMPWMLDDAFVRLALIEAYFAGLNKAREGN